MFCQRHCHKIFAFTYLQFDRTTPSPRSYSLYSSIYTLLYMKSMLFYWGTHSAMLSRLHIQQNASWETVSFGQRCVEMYQKLIFFILLSTSRNAHEMFTLAWRSEWIHSRCIYKVKCQQSCETEILLRGWGLFSATCFLLIMTQSLITFLFKD